MEEILALILQFFLEVVLQLFGSIGFDVATTRRSGGDQGSAQEGDGCGWHVLFAVFGAVCGGISLIFAPKLMLPNLGLRIANLVAAPLVAGGLSYLFASFVWSGRGERPQHHFWRGFWFALAFGVVRFAYANR